jgi:hypothetical protein
MNGRNCISDREADAVDYRDVLPSDRQSIRLLVSAVDDHSDRYTTLR